MIYLSVRLFLFTIVKKVYLKVNNPIKNTFILIRGYFWDLRDMGTDNRVRPCYIRQVQNSPNAPESKSKGLRVNDQALRFFDTLPEGPSKSFYVKSLDADGDGFLSVNELAAAYQRADINGNQERDEWGGISLRDDGKTTHDELMNAFALDGAIPYLLSKAKEANPEKYAQIEQRLKTGTFTTTEEFDDNFFREKQRGGQLVSSVIRAVKEYENLEKVSPDKKGLFFDRLAKGEALDFLRPASKEREAYSFENNAAQRLCKNVFTREKREGYRAMILNVIKDRQTFSQFATAMGEEVQREISLELKTEVKTPIIITDEKFEDKIAYYDWRKNEIALSRPILTSLRDSMKSKGDSDDKIKRELVRQIIEVIPHEYLHAGQYAAVKNPPKDATPEQLAVIKKWANNFANYLDISESKKRYGSTKEYAQQPIEDSAFHLMWDIDKYLQKEFPSTETIKPPTENTVAKRKTFAKHRV